jgi:regulatory protein
MDAVIEEKPRDRRKPYDAGIDLLSRREHSRKELRTKLLRKNEFTPEEVDEALERLEAQGYLSEARFAKARARSLFRKGFGESYVRGDLASKGVSLGREALVESREDAAGAQDPLDAARAIVEKKLRGEDPSALDRDTRRALERRVLGTLQRKGYSLDEALKVLAERFRGSGDFTG